MKTLLTGNCMPYVLYCCLNLLLRYLVNGDLSGENMNNIMLN